MCIRKSNPQLILSLWIGATTVIIIAITQPVMVTRELYIVKINIYTLDKSSSALFIIRKDIILITTHQKRERRKRLNKNKNNPKRPFNNTLLNIKAIRIIKITIIRLA